jgi:hypothetical protein
MWLRQRQFSRRLGIMWVDAAELEKANQESLQRWQRKRFID